MSLVILDSFLVILNLFWVILSLFVANFASSSAFWRVFFCGPFEAIFCLLKSLWLFSVVFSFSLLFCASDLYLFGSGFSLLVFFMLFFSLFSSFFGSF